MIGTRISASQGASVEIVRGGQRHVSPAAGGTLVNEVLGALRGRFVVDHFRGGRRINVYSMPNGITIEGKNKLLNVMFQGATTQITQWYLGLIDLIGYATGGPGAQETDTYDEIGAARANDWQPFTNYTDANNGDSAVTRPEWNPDTASSKSITNSSVAIYDITADGDVKGVFVVGGGTAAMNKNDYAGGGTLWATAFFTSDVAVLTGDQLKVTYTVSA
jgi:hypothetical protein